MCGNFITNPLGTVKKEATNFINDPWQTLGTIGGAVLGSTLAPGIGTAIGASLGNAAGGAASQGPGNYANNLGPNLENAGLAGAGAYGAGQLAGGFGSAFPDTSASIGSGLGDVADSTGLTDVGNSISSGLSDAANSLGLSGVSSPGSITSTDLPSLTDARSAVSDASTAGAAPTSTLSGYLPTGGSAPGGGMASGFSTDTGTSFGSPAAVDPVGSYSPTTPASTFGVTPLDTSVTNSLNPSLGTSTSQGSPMDNSLYNFGVQSPDISGLNASNFQYGQGTAAPSSTGFNPMSLANMAAKGGLSYLLQNNNQGGYNALQQAGQQSAANYQPFLNTGQAATTSLGNLYGLHGQAAQQAAQQNWQNTPGYQFDLNQGLNALDASAASRGMLMSGNQQQAVQKYGTGLADQTYNNYLSGLQNAAGQGVGAAQGVGNGQQNAAAAYAAGKGQQAGSYNTMLNSLGSALFPTSNLQTNNGANNGALSYLSQYF